MERATVSPVTRVALDARTLLARIDRRIAELRRALQHDHRDVSFWKDSTAAQAQSERAILRQVANLLHVERATVRGRIHGTRFASFEDQRAWLARHENIRCARAALHAGVSADATLAKLRSGELVEDAP